MSEISFFQRYDKRENQVTNNTLLMLRHLYNESPKKLNSVLSTLTDMGEEFFVGVSFNQQVKGTSSVPDAQISQSPVSIYFETKTDGKLDEDQLKRHVDSIISENGKEQTNILFGLTVSPTDKKVDNDLNEYSKDKNIHFFSITCKDLLKSLKDQCNDYETKLVEILKDYEKYIIDENLLVREDLMVVFPVGQTYDHNVEFKIYFEPSERPSKAKLKFIGLYKEKCISHIGEISQVVTGKYLNKEKDEFEITNEEKSIPLKEEHKNRIESVAREHGLCAEHRFYLFDDLKQLNFRKTSRGGMMNLRYFYLNDFMDEPVSDNGELEGIAQRLEGKVWE